MAESAADQAIDTEDALNRLAAGYYVCGLVGLLVMMVVVANASRLSSILYLSHSAAAKAVSQTIRRLLLGVSVGSVLIFPHWLLVVAVYVGLNVGLIAWKMTWTNQAYLGSRCGWIAVCNMCLVIFLAMKNTPLSPLAGQTYRDLNVLHRICGYVTVLEIILHGSLFSSGLVKVHAVSELTTSTTYAGVVAGIAMIVAAVTASWFFRRKFYEAFFTVHVLAVVVILISVGVHQSDIQDKVLIVVIVSAAIWVLDRLIRTGRWLYYGYHGFCTLMPLPHGATRVTMTRAMWARPGSHAFLWIPSIRLFEQHPFSLLAEDPAEFIITARRGFTKTLYEKACKNPGMRCRAMIEGPYGTAPNVRNFDKLLLISGGSGVTFAAAMAMEWLRLSKQRGLSTTLQFVWVVRSTSQFQWFLPLLQELRAHPQATVVLHVTSEPTEQLADDAKYSMTDSRSPSGSSEDSTKNLMHDLEKGATTDAHFPPTRPHKPERGGSSMSLRKIYSRGRPVVDVLFENAIAGSLPNEKILVTGSGPDQLLSDIQAATGNAIETGGPTIHLHLEAYEW